MSVAYDLKATLMTTLESFLLRISSTTASPVGMGDSSRAVKFRMSDCASMVQNSWSTLIRMEPRSSVSVLVFPHHQDPVAFAKPPRFPELRDPAPGLAGPGQGVVAKRVVLRGAAEHHG